jgi:hypothetical protein
MWAKLEGDVWVEARPPVKHAGISYPPNVFVVWTEAELAEIGIYPVTQVEPPEGEQATGWELADVDGLPVRRPTGTEVIPTPPPGDLSRLRFWGLVRALDAAEMNMTARLTAARTADPDVDLALEHANTYPWAEFAAIAVATGATAEEMAAVEAAWRSASA